MNEFYIPFLSPIGVLYLMSDKNYLTRITIHEPYGERKETEILRNAKKQLEEYFDGVRKGFELPYRLNVPHLTKEVLFVVKEIPYGSTISYGEIARRVGMKGARAIGSILRRNPLPIIIPCHRVIRSKGSIGGYSLGVKRKKYLLELERGEFAKKPFSRG